jgi:hypothetical protein
MRLTSPRHCAYLARGRVLGLGEDTLARDIERLDGARRAYREALEAARASPTPESWARLLAAGKELSSATESKPKSRRRRGANAAEVIAADAEPGERVDAEAESRLE